MSLTSNYIFTESQKTFKKNSNDTNSRHQIQIPNIKLIAGIPVYFEVSILKEITSEFSDKKKNNYYIIVIIESSKISIGNNFANLRLLYWKEKLTKFSPKQIEKKLLFFKDKMTKIKLDKLNGIFCFEDDKITFKNIGNDIFGLEYSNCEKCSVCYEQTYTKSSCEHSLCVECWSNIKNNKCPLCRAFLHMKDEDDDDDDEEDDY